MKPLLTIILLLLLVFDNGRMKAQSTARALISGKVFDNSTKLPLQYATVSVTDRISEKTINGSIADSYGAFSVSNIPFGTYKIVVTFLGYQNYTIDSVTLSSSKASVSLGKIYLTPTTHTLSEVTIAGDKPVIENKIDKVVYNVANDVTSQGGLAVDVLRKVPNVTVDIDGNVELQGNSNIRFLINGKPSSVFGNNISDALASIPASQIKSIEAITSPGAKYDSQGTGGIINIILNDDKLKGVNGNISLSAGTRLENGSGNLNLRRNNIGFNAYFGGRAFLRSDVPNSQDRTSTDTIMTQISDLSQKGISRAERRGFRSGIGFDWDISKKDNITGSLGYNLFRSINSGLSNQEQLTEDYSGNILSDILTERNSYNNSRYRSLDLSLSYKKSFKKEGQELNLLIDNSHGKPFSEFNQTQIYVGESMPYYGSASANPGTDNQTNISVDYEHPVSEAFLFETGAKTTFQSITSIADVSVFSVSDNNYISDPLQSYRLKYDMKIYAGYLSGTLKLFKTFSVKAGLRYEATNVKVDFPGAAIPSYGTLSPNVVLSYNINKTTTLKLSYSKRIERPEYQELNPFKDVSNPNYISTGNPLLKPEIGNNFELGFNTGIRKSGNLNISLFENINSQNITDFTTFYPLYMVGDSAYSNVSVTTRQNLGQQYNTGFTVSASVPLTSHLKIRGNLVMTYRKVVSDLSTINMSTGVRTRVNMNVNYELPRDLVFEAFGFFNAAARNIQGKTPQFFIYNFAFRKLFWNKNASFGFTTTNPFSHHIRQVSTITTEYSMARTVREMPFRSFGVSFTYKFGKLESKKGRGDDNNQIQDLN